ncbi:MAG: RNA polymerase sigma factor [Myxococcota bacterium]
MNRREELARVFERDRERLTAVALRIVRNEADAADAVQDAFASALRNIDGFRGDAQLSTWLHRIVCNAGLMRLRSRRRRPECPLEPEREARLADAARGADEQLASRQLGDELMRAAHRLDPASLELLTARYFRDEPLRSIARRHRISPSAAKTRVHRARTALRRLVETPPAATGPAPLGLSGQGMSACADTP